MNGLNTSPRRKIEHDFQTVKLKTSDNKRAAGFKSLSPSRDTGKTSNLKNLNSKKNTQTSLSNAYETNNKDFDDGLRSTIGLMNKDMSTVSYIKTNRDRPREKSVSISKNFDQKSPERSCLYNYTLSSPNNQNVYSKLLSTDSTGLGYQLTSQSNCSVRFDQNDLKGSINESNIHYSSTVFQNTSLAQRPFNVKQKLDA